MNNFKLNFVMIGHEAPKERKLYEKDENGKRVKDGKQIGTKTEISTLFVRGVDPELGEDFNKDTTYPYCNTVVLRLSPELFAKIRPLEPLTFVCDSFKIDFDEKIIPRKVKIDGEFISLKSEDVDETKTSMSSLETL